MSNELPMRILAFVPGGIGDQILFFPTIEDLKRTHPNAQIDVVVEPRSKAAYQVCKSFPQVIPFDFKDTNGPADWGNLLGIIRDKEYDAVLSLGQRFGVGFFLWLTGIPQRVGYGVGAGKMFLTSPVTLNQNQYAAAMYHDLVKGLGIDRPCPPLSINVPKADIAWAEDKLKEMGISTYILVHGGASKLSQKKGIEKIYPANQWQRVVDGLQSRQDKPVVFVEGPDDQELIAKVLQTCPNVKVIKPPDIGKLTALIAGASLMICTNSGPMHLATAAGTYTFALFGPTDPTKVVMPGGKTIAIKSRTGKIADISPAEILDTIWKS
jgi:ADP-heptose:LPS heptosyltransferase